MSLGRPLSSILCIAPADANPLPSAPALVKYCESFAIVSESTGAHPMTCIPVPLGDGSISVLSIILASARRWREARDTGLNVQPHLFVSLAPHGCGILAPVIDSALSQDEALLLDLLTGTKGNPVSLGDGGGMGRAFDIAIASTRIMACKAFRLPVLA